MRLDPVGSIRFLVLVILVSGQLVAGLSCGEDPPLGPSDRELTVSGKPSAGTGDPIVLATVPNTAPQDTTLDVQVSGSGFDRGSRVDLALDGVVGPKVKTNSTRFVNKSTLVANITIAADAEPDLYDVLVTTTKGKRGIGIELFEITYAMTILGTLPGDDASDARVISGRGEIYGGSGRSVPYSERTFAWTNGIMREVGPGTPIAASENGRVVGATPPSIWEDFNGIWQQTFLPILPGPLPSQAQNITPDGTAIVGASGGKAVLWRETPQGWTIEVLPGTCVCDISASGLILGLDQVWMDVNGSWTSYALGPSAGGTKPVGWAINDQGDVAGWDEDGSGRRRALVWRKTPSGWAAPEQLGTLGGGSAATALNNMGSVVGYSEIPGQTSGSMNHHHAFVWTPLDGMIDLGSRGTDNVAWDINDSGLIVGSSRKATGGNFAGNYVAVVWDVQ